MKLKKLIVAVLVVVLAMSFVGCNSTIYKEMRADLTKKGYYSAAYDQYKIELEGDVDYYCYGDSDNIWLSYHKYGSTNYSFYIVFNKDLDGNYTWYFDYDEYEFRGDLDASRFTKNTKYLIRDSYYGTDSSSELLNLKLEELAATVCKLCLTSLSLYFTKSDFNAELSDLGFKNYK